MVRSKLRTHRRAAQGAQHATHRNRRMPTHVSSGTVGTTFGKTSSNASRSPGFGAGQL